MIAPDERPLAPPLPDRAEALMARTAVGDDTGASRVMAYKRIDGRDLVLTLVPPRPGTFTQHRAPAVVLFHGGGWVKGSKQHFQPQATVLAELGYAVVLPEYRLLDGSTTVFDAIDDAADAFLWLRDNQARLGVNPSRIALGGGSAGGHLAMAVATLPRCRALTRECGPAALVLFNPVFDNGPQGFAHQHFGDRYLEGSPAHNLHPGLCPTLTMLGTHDTLVPVETVRRVHREMRKHGVPASLKLFEGAGHGFFNPHHEDDSFFRQTLREAAAFLAKWHPGSAPETGAARENA